MKSNTFLKRFILLISIPVAIGSVGFLWYICATPKSSALNANLQMRAITFSVSQFNLKPFSTSELTINGHAERLSLTGCFSSTGVEKSCDGDSKKIDFDFLGTDSKLTLNSTNIKIAEISVEKDTTVTLQGVGKNVNFYFNKKDPTQKTKITFSFSGPIKLTLTNIKHKPIQANSQNDAPQLPTEELWFTPLSQTKTITLNISNDPSLEIAASGSSSEPILKNTSISNLDLRSTDDDLSSAVIGGEVFFIDRNNKRVDPPLTLTEGQFLFIKPYFSLFSPLLSGVTQAIGFNRLDKVTYDNNSSKFNIDLSGYAFQVSQGARDNTVCNVPKNCIESQGKLVEQINYALGITLFLSIISSVSAWFGVTKFENIRQIFIVLMKAASGNDSKSSSESPSDKSD